MPRKLPARQSYTPVVVVAGGAGFLGSHICESLLQSGVNVVALDNLVTGSLCNLSTIKQHPNFEFIECNINQGIPAALHEKAISHIIHAAGVETHGESNAATLAMALTGAFGTKNLLDLAVSSGARFLLISSVNVYEGLASSTNLSYYFGSSPEQEARFSQHEAKRYAEGLCELYARDYNLDARVARVSQLYGPRMDLRSPELVSRLLRATMSGNDLEVDVDGSTTLLLTYVTDAVYGISRLLFAEGANFKGSIYSFANPEKVSVISIAYTLRDFLPPGKEVKFLPVDQQPTFSIPKLSLERGKQDLDWEPTVSVTAGLKLTVEAFKQTAPDIKEHAVTSQHLQTIADPVLPPAKENEDSPSLQRSTTGKQAVQTKDKQDVPGLRFRGAGTEPEAAPLAANSNPEPVKPATGREVTSTKRTRKKPVKVPSWWRKLLFGSAAVVVYAMLARPVVHTATYGVAGALDLRSGIEQTKSLQFDKAEQSFNSAETSLMLSSSSAEGLGWIAALIGQSDTLRQVRQGLTGASQTAGGLVTLCQAMEPLVGQAQHLVHFDKPLPQDDGSFANTLDDAAKTIAQARQQLQKAQATFDQPANARVAGASWHDGREDHSGTWMAGLLRQGQDLLSQLLWGLDRAEAFMAVLPEALGESQPKTYLIMLQNSNELRPTGGFLGSYALAKLENGRISDFKIDDIYNPAGQLQKEQLDPAPLPFQKAFGVKRLSLIDANWSPNTPDAGRRVAELYTKATGVEVDGVVFVTTQAMKPVMAAAGPMKLDGYKEVITADNFIQLAQVYSDVGFTPGSTAKADFLGELANQLLYRLQTAGPSVWLPATKAVASGLEQKEISIWSGDKPVMTVLDKQGWTGKILATKGDYLRVVDANLAGNKSNYYVQRSTSYAINVDRNSALHGVATITWKHSGKSATWPGGDYVNYVRLYVPKDSVLNGSSGFDAEGVTIGQEGDKTVFGGFVRVPYNSQKTVEVRYSLPLALSLPKQEGLYSLLWQKQPGINSEPLTVTFNAPVFLDATAITGGGQEQEDGSVVWQSSQTDDADFTLQLQNHRKS